MGCLKNVDGHASVDDDISEWCRSNFHGFSLYRCLLHKLNGQFLPQQAPNELPIKSPLEGRNDHKTPPPNATKRILRVFSVRWLLMMHEASTRGNNG